MTVLSPKEERSLALLNRWRFLLRSKGGIDLRGPSGEIEKHEARIEFKSYARPIFSANVRQGVDRTQRSIGCIEGV